MITCEPCTKYVNIHSFIWRFQNRFIENELLLVHIDWMLLMDKLMKLDRMLPILLISWNGSISKYAINPAAADTFAINALTSAHILLFSCPQTDLYITLSVRWFGTITYNAHLSLLSPLCLLLQKTRFKYVCIRIEWDENKIQCNFTTGVGCFQWVELGWTNFE